MNTQVHGSMTGKNVLQIDQSVKDKKEKELWEKETRKKQKDQKREIFFLFQERICVAMKYLQLLS